MPPGELQEAVQGNEAQILFGDTAYLILPAFVAGAAGVSGPAPTQQPIRIVIATAAEAAMPGAQPPEREIRVREDELATEQWDGVSGEFITSPQKPASGKALAEAAVTTAIKRLKN